MPPSRVVGSCQLLNRHARCNRVVPSLRFVVVTYTVLISFNLRGSHVEVVQLVVGEDSDGVDHR
jgi:hypothetical protein